MWFTLNVSLTVVFGCLPIMTNIISIMIPRITMSEIAHGSMLERVETVNIIIAQSPHAKMPAERKTKTKKINKVLY